MTLLELLIVLTLIGVTTALVLPVFGGRPGDEAGHEQDVARVLSTGRREAIRRAQTMRLTVAQQGVWTLRGVRDDVVVDSGRLVGERLLAHARTVPQAARARQP